jgi:hypothetical protein
VPDPAACLSFVSVSQAVCGTARDYWSANGGLAVFGLPISQPFEEGGRQVQYFERARFELRGERIELGLLGRELLYPSLAARPVGMARRARRGLAVDRASCGHETRLAGSPFERGRGRPAWGCS